MIIRIVLFVLGFSLLASATSFAGFDQGRQAYDRKDWRTAILNLRPDAEKGDARAMVLLANMYASGYGVEKNEAEAFGLYRRAAVENNADGMIATATMYQRGIGVPKNIPMAIGWYKRGAQLGHQASAFFYAIHLYQGSKGDDYDIQPDHVLAYKWFRIAANTYSNEKLQRAALEMADQLAKELTQEQVKTTDDLVASWKPLAIAELGPLPEEAIAKAEEKLEQQTQE